MKNINFPTIQVIILSMILVTAIPYLSMAQKGCVKPVSQEQFEPYKGAIKGESFSSNQMEVAKQVALCLNTTQIRSIMDLFSFEDLKLDYAKWAFSNCTDKANYYLLNSAFSFSSSKSELSQFVKSKPAVVEETQVADADVNDQEPEPAPSPTKKVNPPKKTGWEPKKQTKMAEWEKQNQKSKELYNEPFKKAQDQMQAFFVMTLGLGENQIDQPADVHKPEEDETDLPAKAPRVVITHPELSQENNFTATTKDKKTTVSGVISSSVGIYEVFINETEAILNQKGEFFGDVFLSPGENQIAIRAKDTKGQNSKIGFKIIRENNRTIPEPPKEEIKKDNLPSPVVPPIPSTVFVSEVDKDVPKLNKSNKDAIAVVIGNAKYSKTKPVDFAENDARSMKNYLISMLGFKEGNILYYENATLGDMNTIFGTSENPKGRLFNTIKQGVSDVIIFYSGHGAPGLKSNKAYFVPVEADPNYMENSGYSLDILYRNLKKLPAKSITFFSDACFSGADVFDKISPMVIRSKEPVKDGLKNTTLINSCTGTEVSCWHSDEKHGLFTFYLLKALKNYQETDLNKDRQVTLDEVFKSVADNNEGVPYFARRQFGLNQTPVIQGPKTKILFKY